MVEQIEWIPETIQSLDCPAAPFVDDCEDKVITHHDTHAEQRPPVKVGNTSPELCN
jgi:hypothetical protein